MAIDRQAISAAVTQRLSERSVAHCERVAQTAETIALTYGVDADAAWAGAMLHDWDRDLDAATLTSTAATLGVSVTEVDTAVPYLLHARTAAADLARTMPELPADVLDAVARHTLGAPDMTDLDIVVFVADMVEPGRTWSGVDELRAEVGTLPLPALFFSAYRRSLMHLVDVGKRIHPDTVAVWNELVGSAR